jgi:hypothetical protein
MKFKGPGQRWQGWRVGFGNVILVVVDSLKAYHVHIFEKG